MLELNEFIKNNQVVQYGQFELASGKLSNIYCDAKKITLNPKGLWPASIALLHLLGKVEFDAIGSDTGASPLVGGILAATYFCNVRDRDVKGFTIRKEPKGHGLKKFIEGPVEPGMKVIIVEDVITTGKSVLLAIERAQEFGLNVQAVAALINRQEGADKLLVDMDMPFFYARKIGDFLE